jgi:hypothetical protein
MAIAESLVWFAIVGKPAARSSQGFAFFRGESHGTRAPLWYSGVVPTNQSVVADLIDAGEDWLASTMEKLYQFADLQTDWDGDGAPAPSPVAVARAERFLYIMHATGDRPSRVAPSVAGGIGITVRSGGRKAYVEFYNDGTAFVLFADEASEPVARPVRAEHASLVSLLGEIREHVNAGNA